MIEMKCPRCDHAAEVPAALVDDEHKCQYCNIPLAIADPDVVAERSRIRRGQYRGLAIGSGIGAVVVPLIGGIGGAVGMAVAGGVAGAAVGAVAGLVLGMMNGVFPAVMRWDDSWITYKGKITAVLGCLLGLAFGMSGHMVDKFGPMLTLAASGIGGLALGGLLGALLGRIWARETSRRPEAGG